MSLTGAGPRRTAGPGRRAPFSAAEGALRRELARRGMRLTTPRRMILDVVRATDGHPTAEGVHAEVRKRLPHVSLATVYRNLRVLAEQGLLAELHQGSSARFDGRLSRHHHFTCATCGRIFDLEEPPVDPRLDARVAARTGFRVSHHRIEFFGACEACASRGPRRARRGSVPGRT